MVRTIIKIDEDKCDGCGLCVSACHEGALGLVEGKARLLRDDYCDGMGDCLPACPAGAISFIEREAAAYDEAAVQANAAANAAANATQNAAENAGANADANEHVGCEGGCAVNLDKLVEKLSSFLDNPIEANAAGATDTAGVASIASAAGAPNAKITSAEAKREETGCDEVGSSHLRNWPVQIKLAPPVAPYFSGCDLLIAADCTAFTHGDFHAQFMRGRVTLIGCPKLDAVDYAEKLGAILANNDVRSVTVTRMSVPCCGGIEAAAKRAVAASGKDIPLDVVTFSTEGNVI